VIEIRHYVNRTGKDVFDDWLTQLADARAQAKIATRINRLPPEILAIASLCVKD
jgi:putative component of toxin-antitoxin plasmid stabilization module